MWSRLINWRNFDLQAGIFCGPSTGGCAPAKAAEIRSRLLHSRQKLYDGEKFRGGRAALRKAIELDPNLAVAYNLLVAIYVEANKLPEALKELKTVLAKNPQDARHF